MATVRLTPCEGLNIDRICGNAFTDPAQNHCAHLVCHWLNLSFGYTCRSAGRANTTGANVRVHELFARCPRVGRWADKRDSNRLTPLMVAAMNGDAGMVSLLLARGADPDLQAPGGLTALDFALQRGDGATSQLLQSRGAR